MKIIIQSYLDSLKQESLKLADIAIIESSDCYPLSLLIEKKTQKRISETTLKRVFGFAASCYNPSTYTLNALSEYCDYKSWADFLIQKEKEGLDDEKDQSWGTIIERAHKISRFNIESNKLKSGISYLFTIYRKGLDAIIDEFAMSEATACVIKAPAGGGKTLAITQWMDRNINKKNEAGKKDIFLLINTTTLISSSVFSFHGNHWLSFLLGLENVDLLDEFIKTYKDSAPGNFYLVIDDSGQDHINARQYEAVFSQLVEMANHFSSLKWFKIIVSIRTNIFHKYKYLIERTTPIQPQWHIKNCNLKGFSMEEMEELTVKLKRDGTAMNHTWNPHIPLIDLPLNFQIYYQQKGINMSPQDLSMADQFMIARTYISKYILKGSIAHEKRIILDKLCRYLQYNGQHLFVEKHKGLLIKKQSPSAYKELTNAGIIYVYSSKIGFRDVEEIRFQSSTFGSFFLAKRLLIKNKRAFDAGLISFINDTHYPATIKLELLQWSIVFAIECEQFQFFDHLHTAKFTKFKEIDLILFIFDYLEYLKNDTEDNKHFTKELNKQLPNTQLIDYALLYFSNHPKYTKQLENILNYTLNPQQRIMIHAALGLLSLFRMEADRLKYHLNKMKQIPKEEYGVFVLNPLTQLEALYRYFKYGEISRNALQEITAFNFNPASGNHSNFNQVLNSLGILVSQTSNGGLKTLRFLRASDVRKSMDKITFTQDYIDFIQIMKAREWLKQDKVEKARSIQFTNPVSIQTNILIQISYSIFKMELAHANGEKLEDFINKITEKTQKNNLPFIELFVRCFNLHLSTVQNASSKDLMILKIDTKALIGTSGFRLDSFKQIPLLRQSLRIKTSRFENNNAMSRMI